MADGMLSLSWNNHRATFCHILATLREKERYTDVTVACEGKFYPVHKLVLSTCSEYFEKIFENTPCKHPVIVLKDVNRCDLEALFCYMYEGAVSVAQSNLGRLIKAAEVLRIKGLAVPDEPPISDGSGRRPTSTHHHHHASDDRSSPHPKRRRREENSHARAHSSPSPPSSPRPSPLHDGGECQPTHRSRSDSQWGEHGAGDREDGGMDGLADDRLADQSTTSHSAPTPPQVEVMVDETLVKEEMIDHGDTGQEDMMDSGMDYGSVGSDSRLEGSAGGGVEEDHMLPGKYEPKTNPSQQAIPEAVVEALAGPSGMQTWLSGGEMPSGFSGLEGYTGGEGGQDLPPPSQAPAAHQLVSPGNPKAKEQEPGMKTVRLAEIPSGENGNFKTIGLLAEGEDLPRPSRAVPYTPRLHYCPYCAFTTAVTAKLSEHLRIHAVQKPFPCPHCSFKSVQVESIRAHIRTHTGEKPFACAHCPYRSTQKGNMKRHIIKHHFVVAFAK